MIRLYGLKNCSTCKKAESWLKEQGIDFSFVDYRDHPIAPADLISYANALGGWEKMVNRSSPTWRSLSDEQRQAGSDDAWTALIAQFPALVRRPLTVFADGTVMVGFNETKYRHKLGI